MGTPGEYMGTPGECMPWYHDYSTSRSVAYARAFRIWAEI